LRKRNWASYLEEIRPYTPPKAGKKVAFFMQKSQRQNASATIKSGLSEFLFISDKIFNLQSFELHVHIKFSLSFSIHVIHQI
jgi:hypothetical protein